MAAYVKFYQYVDDLCKGVHNWTTSTGNVFKVVLTNTAPVQTNTVLANITQIASGNGYTTDGITTTQTLSNTTGTEKVLGTNVVWTGGPSPMAPFRYVVLYNSTPTTPLKPLVAYWDYGTAITLNNSETFTVAFDATNGIWQLT